MGFFGSGDKSTSSVDSRIGASDEALVISTGSGSNSNVGGTMVQGSNLTSLSNSLQNSNNSGTINYGLGAEDFRETISDIGSTLTKSIAAQADAGNSALDASLSKLSDLAMTKATDGESGKNNIVLYIALGALALVAFIFWRK
tara:strand:- start:78 stop:506 length:429 start_codon:yes stop_codon:yes gene_type:complete